MLTTHTNSIVCWHHRSLSQSCTSCSNFSSSVFPHQKTSLKLYGTLCPEILIKISLQMLAWPEVAHLIDRFFPQLLPSRLFSQLFFISCIFSLFIFEKTASTSQVWSPYTKEKIKALERVWRHATKFNLKCDLTYPKRLAKLGLFPIEFRREVLDLFLFYMT